MMKLMLFHILYIYIYIIIIIPDIIYIPYGYD